MTDAVVVGAGPNGLSAAVALAREGWQVLVLEAEGEIGGGTRTAELTLPGFHHDVCSGCHPMGILSPFFRDIGLDVEWMQSDVSVAHPLDDGPAVLLRRSLEETAAGLGRDGPAYRRVFEPFLRDPHALFRDLLAPLHVPRRPFAMAQFGLLGLPPVTWLAKTLFREERARALFAGCAAHSIQPLSNLLTSALALVFLLAGHVESWPVAKGGSRAITDALARTLREKGGRIETGVTVTSLAQLPPSRVVLFDTDPLQVADIAGDALPAGYRRRLRRFRFGPGAFKVDWALDGPIPWKDPAVGQASTVHLGGTLDEIAAAEAAMYRGDHPERPYVLLVQQSALDPTRAPAGKHTGYAYIHVPPRSTVDQTEVMEAQIERFAPGFRDVVLARHVRTAAGFAAYNRSFVGGAPTGGTADLTQMFTRPVTRWDPYSTPNPRLYICSAATPPGGGVHGMCGWFGARSALRRIARLPVAPW